LTGGRYSEVAVSTGLTVHTSKAFMKSVLKTICYKSWIFSGYFLDSLDRLSSRDFVPNNDDILRSRNRTTGIEEFKFHYKVSVGNLVESIFLFKYWDKKLLYLLLIWNGCFFQVSWQSYCLFGRQLIIRLGPGLFVFLLNSFF